MRTIGTVAAIWRYPVKSLAPQELAAIDVAQDGLTGDRTSAMVVKSGHARAGKPYRGKENNLLHTRNSTASARRLAALRGVEVSRERAQPHYYDGAPVSILLDSWLREASDLAGYALEPLRFRPNFYLTTGASSSERENALVGRSLRLGSAWLRVRSPIVRCTVTTYDLRTGRPDPGVLRALVEKRDAILGIYCDVVEPGAVARTDTLAVLE